MPLSAAPSRKVPSPADVPTMSARLLLARTRRRGGRIYRMRELCVFVLTDDPKLAEWLLELGGRAYLPPGASRSNYPVGSFRMSKGAKPQWDIYVHSIPVKGEQTIWEAAAELDAEPFDPNGALPYEEAS